MSLPVAAAEIVHACLESGSEAAWTAFVKYFQPLIASSVSRVVSRYGPSNPSLIDDLTQETYLRLCRDNFRSLRTFQAQHDEAIFGYIKVIATSIAIDHFRARTTQKRGGEVEDDGTDHATITSSAAIEHSALLQELDQLLVVSETERDRNIFWLYYRQGYTTRDIASMPDLGLTQKGVESCIHRVTQSLRDVVNCPPKGLPPQNTLGEMK
ncbi:MAG: sigma-70 family RNA polymerase sigma factor [Edaphobacter sp.]